MRYLPDNAARVAAEPKAPVEVGHGLWIGRDGWDDVIARRVAGRAPDAQVLGQDWVRVGVVRATKVSHRARRKAPELRQAPCLPSSLFEVRSQLLSAQLGLVPATESPGSKSVAIRNFGRVGR